MVFLPQNATKFGFASYKLDSNHTISIRGILIADPNPSQKVCGYLQTRSEKSAFSTLARKKIIKIESLRELPQIAHIKELSLVLAKMDSAYLPANPIPKIEQKHFKVLLLTKEDWKLVSVSNSYFAAPKFNL